MFLHDVPDSGFNPSFTGIALVAGEAIDDGAEIVFVSILLLLELPWWHGSAKKINRSANRFQSFFYWNCLGGTKVRNCSMEICSSFNPSFTGIALVAYQEVSAWIR